VAETSTAVDGSDPAALVEGYEAMRDAVVGGRAEGWRHGYGILATGGMVAWMGAWASLAPAPAAGTPAPPSGPSTPSPCPASTPSMLSSLPNAGAIVSVVAQMALAHL
jgi:hypothetical protein